MLERQDVMPEVDSQPKPQTVPAGDGPDPLAGLYHMSNTAGLSTQDYVAINPVAIWSVFFGVASVLVVLSNVLLGLKSRACIVIQIGDVMTGLIALVVQILFE